MSTGIVVSIHIVTTLKGILAPNSLTAQTELLVAIPLNLKFSPFPHFLSLLTRMNAESTLKHTH